MTPLSPSSKIVVRSWFVSEQPASEMYPADLEAIAIEAASTAAHAIRAETGAIRAIRMKSTPTDPVTHLDLEAERIIRKVLAERTPDASVLGEEDGGSSTSSGIGWVIDPIDGTVNLTYGLPITSVSIGATMDGKVVAGCVVDIMRGEAFSASAGRGARMDSVPIGVTQADELAASLIATGFDYSAEGRVLEAEHFARILPAARDVRCIGSAALNLCWVACGRFDGFYQRNMQYWDYAAGAIIAAEAGAGVQVPTADDGNLMVAANPTIFEALLSVVT
jgi:myo-inositol-1(or 4)-monophosphatase